MAEMVIIENADFSVDWECSTCLKTFNGTRRFEESEVCPNCGDTIEEWVGIDDVDEDA